MAEMIQLELNDAALSEKVNKLIDGGLPIEIHVPSDHQHHDALQRSLEYFSTGLDPIGFWSTTRQLTTRSGTPASKIEQMSSRDLFAGSKSQWA
ncbi:MAG: hypothetical protein AAFV69_14700 [Pseudomonadota bacterium]